MLAIFVTLTSVVCTIGTLRFDNAIPLPRDDRSADSLAKLAVWSVTLTAAFLAITAALFGGALDQAIFQSRAVPFTWLLALAVAAYACAEVHNARLIRAGRFAELSKMRVVFSISCLAAQLSVPLLWVAGPLGLVLGQIGGYAGELALAHFLQRHDRLPKTPTTLGDLRRVAVEYRKYPAFDVSSSLLRILSANGQALMIAWLYGPAAAGCLLLAQRLLLTPLSMLSFSISRVYYSEAATMAREAPAELRSLFLTTAKRLSLLVAPPLALVAVLAPWTFALVFGREWAAAGIYCSFLCPLIFLRVIAFVVAPTLDVIHRQGLRLLRELACVVLIGLGIGLARWLDWSAQAAVASTAALGCVGYAASIAVTWRALLAYHRHHIAQSDVPQHALAA
jgi:O-antigen/teichoic acid export membrane protein